MHGKDNKLIQVEKKKAKIDLGLVGQITDINTEAMLEQIRHDKIVVVLPMGRGQDKNIYNILNKITHYFYEQKINKFFGLSGLQKRF